MADLSGAHDDLVARAGAIFAGAIDFVYEETRRFCPVGKTSATLDSIHLDPEGGEYSNGVYSTQISAQGGGEFSDEGTKGPYIIQARGKALVFDWPNGPNGAGTYHFRFVTHPGVKGTHWFREAMPDRFQRGLEAAQ